MNGDFSRGWNDVTRQTLEGGRLSCAIDTQHDETFAVVHSERDPLDGSHRLEILLVGLREVVDSDCIVVVLGAS